MIAAGRTHACQPGNYLHIPYYEQFRRKICDEPAADFRGALRLPLDNKCDALMCDVVAKVSKGLTKDQIKRLGFALKWLAPFVQKSLHKKCVAYAKNKSRTLPPDLKRRAFPSLVTLCTKNQFTRGWTKPLIYNGRRYGGWRDFLQREPRLACPSNRVHNAYAATPRCIKPLLSIAKIKAILQRRYGRMTFKRVVKGLVYELDVVVHRMVNKRLRDTGVRSLKVDGYTGRLLSPRRIRPILPFSRIKKILERKYGKITYKEVKKGPVYKLRVIIHRMNSIMFGSSFGCLGGADLKVDGHTGRLISLQRHECVFPL